MDLRSKAHKSEYGSFNFFVHSFVPLHLPASPSSIAAQARPKSTEKCRCPLTRSIAWEHLSSLVFLLSPILSRCCNARIWKHDSTAGRSTMPSPGNVPVTSCMGKGFNTCSGLASCMGSGLMVTPNTKVARLLKTLP